MFFLHNFVQIIRSLYFFPIVNLSSDFMHCLIYKCSPFMIVAVVRKGMGDSTEKACLASSPKYLLKGSGRFEEVDHNSCVVDWAIHPL